MLETVSAIIEATDGAKEATSDDGLLELGTYLSTEFAKDVKYGTGLTNEQVTEVVGLVREFAGVLTDILGTTTLVSHHSRLVTDVPVRTKPYVVFYSVRKSLQTFTK